MNDILNALILAVVQGLTEWLPVSSSGHLVVFQKLLGVEPDLLFSVALHFGTLMAVFVYFGEDIVNIIRDVLSGKWKSEDGRTGLLLIVASIPAGVIGYAFADLFESTFSNLLVTGVAFGVTGMFLLIASIDFQSIRPTHPPVGNEKRQLSFMNSLWIGFAQALAIIPGISRSGATMASSMLLGLEQKAAARFAFLMAIPVIFGANILTVGNQTLPSELIWATLVSFVVGLMAMHWLFKFVLNDKRNLRWFAGYTLILGVIVLFWNAI